MIGKKVEYPTPNTVHGRSVSTGIILDKILIDGTEYYIIENISKEIDTIKCNKILKII